MKSITTALALTLGLAGALFATAPHAQEADAPPAPMRAEVLRDGDIWSVRFHFPEAAPLWAFQRSALQRRGEMPWRPESWRVITAGVSLERFGNFDALVAQDGDVPEEVVIAFKPMATDLMADYDPAMIFSNGSLALYSGHYSAFPAQSAEELEGLSRPRGYPKAISMQALGEQVFLSGKYLKAAEGIEDSYVIFGPVTLVATDRVTTILDPGLPQWLADGIGTFNTETFAFYASRLGDHAEDTPTILAAWAGPTPEMLSMGGSVSANMVSMRLEGIGLVEESPEAMGRIQWFYGHEAAHFWLGQTIAYDDRKDAWFTEGGADLMAMHIMDNRDQQVGMTSADLLAEAREDCAALLESGGVYTAAERLEHRANYACGSLFSLAVERAGAQRGEDFFDFVSLLITRHRGENIGTDEWIAAARDFGLAEDKAVLIKALLENGALDGAAALTSLLDS